MPPTIISINTQQSPTSDSRSDYTDDTASTGTGEHIPMPTVSDHEDSDDLEGESWEGIDHEEYEEDIIEPSDSASRPRAASRYRSESRPAPVRQRARRATTEHTVRHTSGHRLHSRGPRPAPDAPSSVDEYEHYPAYGRPYPPAPYGRGGYPQSHVGGFGSNPFQADPRHSGAMMPFQTPGTFQQYPPANPFSPAGGDPRSTSYFGHTPGGHGHPSYTGHELTPYGAPHGYGYGGYGLPPGMNHFPYEQYPHSASPPAPAPAPPAAAPAPPPPPPPAPATPAPPPVDPEVVKAQQALELQVAQLKLENEAAKREKDAREAADKKKSEDEAAQKAADARVAEEVTKARLKVLEEQAMAEEKAKADAARLAEEVTKARLKVMEEQAKAEEKARADAAQAIADAEAKTKAEADMKMRIEAELKAKAEKEAKDTADKTKADAEAKEKLETEVKAKIEAEMKAKAEKEAKEAAAKAPPPAEKQKPIRFKDAVGRKFSFPFHLCATWGGMEDLIKQAFLHVEVIGPHVADGHYDLVGPNGEIILPQVWETMIEPDWAITMHMWPMPERPKPPPPEGPIIIDGGPGPVRPPGRRPRVNVGGPPPGGRPRAPPPPPASRRGGGSDLPPGIVLVESDGPAPPRKKKSTSKTTSFFGFGGSSSKSKGKGKK